MFPLQFALRFASLLVNHLKNAIAKGLKGATESLKSYRPRPSRSVKVKFDKPWRFDLGRAKVKLNGAGIARLLKSAAVQAELERRANAIAGAAGPGMKVESNPSSQRARVSVHTDTFEAKQAEATDRRLTRAIDAGRG